MSANQNPQNPGYNPNGYPNKPKPQNNPQQPVNPNQAYQNPYQNQQAPRLRPVTRPPIQPPVINRGQGNLDPNIVNQDQAILNSNYPNLQNLARENVVEQPSSIPQPKVVTPAQIIEPNKSNKPKRNLAPLIFGLTVFLITLSALGVVLYSYLNNSNPTATVSSSSESSAASSSSSSREAFYFPRFFNPSDNRSNANNSQGAAVVLPDGNNTSAGASRSLPKVFDVAIGPKNTKVDKKVYPSISCGSGIYTTNGVTEIKNTDNLGTFMNIAHKNMIIDQKDSANFERAVNYIKKNTDFMADTGGGYGPDFLQFLRKECNPSQIERIKEYDVNQYKLQNVEAYRVISDIRSTNNIVDISINIYAKKDDYIIGINKVFPYSSFFNRQQIETCTQNGSPVRSCFKDLLLKDSNLNKTLDDEGKKLVEIYAL